MSIEELTRIKLCVYREGLSVLSGVCTLRVISPVLFVRSFVCLWVRRLLRIRVSRGAIVAPGAATCATTPGKGLRTSRRSRRR